MSAWITSLLGDSIHSLEIAMQTCRSVFTCSHTNVRFSEGKSICPDCGEGVIVRWANLRCHDCHSFRPGRYLLRRVLADHRFCHHCGHVETEVEYLESPPFYRIHTAFLVVQNEKDFLSEKTPSWLHRCRAWLDVSDVHRAPKPLARALLPVPI